jgi:hypothetical protein
MDARPWSPGQNLMCAVLLVIVLTAVIAIALASPNLL